MGAPAIDQASIPTSATDAHSEGDRNPRTSLRIQAGERTVARIFLCYTSEDKVQVREVYQQLKALGFTPWLDEVDILPGQNRDYEIEQALETSDFVIMFLSTRSVEKVATYSASFDGRYTTRKRCPRVSSIRFRSSSMIVRYLINSGATNGSTSMKTVRLIGSFAPFIMAFNSAANHCRNR